MESVGYSLLMDADPQVTSSPEKPVLFVNPRSGGGKAARAGLAERARDMGIDAIVLRPGDDLATLVGEAVEAGADALGVAGGDGSLAVVAAAALGHGLPFVCVPAGTRNHFALDVGVDRRDLLGSLDAFTDGVERRIDVAEVNGRLFLNNVSLGIYGDAVRQPAYRDAKARTLIETAAHVLGPSAAADGLQVADSDGRRHLDPAVVLVSNNPYRLDEQHGLRGRPRLDTGLLGIVVLGEPSERPFLLSAKLRWREWTAPSFVVEAGSSVAAGIDGEAARLEPPLRFQIRPAALKVRIARSHPGASTPAIEAPR